MKFKAILLDMDGVLADTLPYIFNAFNYALKEQGLPLMDPSFITLHAGVPMRTIFTLHAPNASVQALVDLAHKYQRENAFLIEGQPGVIPTLQALREQKIPMAVVSGATGVYVHRVLETIGVKSFLSAIISSDDTKKHKPDPEPYLEAARRLNVKPGDCLAVADGARDVESAYAAGCVVARAVYGFGGTEHTQVTPHFQIDSIKEVLDLVK